VIHSLATPAGALERPAALAASAAGQLYVAEQDRVVAVSPAGLVSVFAGGTAPGFGGDGGLATNAALDSPRALAVDDLGDVYIADTANNRVRRVDPSGTITTVAGTGVAGFSGDGGAAVAAQLNAPAGLAIGFGRSLYIADSANNRVRLLRPDGTIVTVAGAGDPGYAGDGAPAISALFDTPQGLAFDHDGNLYVADSLNDRVRVVDLSGIVATVAGTGQGGFSGDGGAAQRAALHLAAGPLNGTSQALTVDSAGRLYIADGLNNRVRVRDAAGVITTVAGDGRPGAAGDGKPAVDAELDLPLSVTVGADGRLYVADAEDNRIRVIG
jgi:ribosomal protein S11